MLAVKAPTDAGLVDPASQLWQVAFVDAEAFAHGGHIQQVENVGGGEAPLGQVQQGFHGLGQGGRGTGTAVAEGIGEIARIVPFQPAEYGVDVRCIGFDVRHHHDHVAGLQARVVAETVEQFILEDFHFPLGAVADAEMEGAVHFK